MNTNEVLNKLIAEIERLKEETPIGICEYDKGEENGRYEVLNHLLSTITSLQQEQPDNEDIDKVAQELYEHLYELKRRNNVPTNLYDKQEIIALWKAGIEYAYNHPKQEQPEVNLEKLKNKAELIANEIMMGVQANKYHTCIYDKTSNDFNHSHLFRAALKGIELGLNARKKELPEIELNKFTEKIKTFQGRYKPPKSFSIKGAMAFMARMFYQYPNVARKWYEQLPKATMDNARKED